MKREKYFYALLRYVHDIAVQEFFSVGVAVYAPTSGYLKFEFRQNAGLAGDILDTNSISDFRALMRMVTRRGEQILNEFNSSLLSQGPQKLDDILLKFFPVDDSALQWSPVTGGLTRDVENTAHTLFERYCGKYDRKKSVTRIRDHDAWRHFNHQLTIRQLERYFSAKDIHGDVDVITFPFAWKNGRWHCFEPVSFDLADKDSIRDKAYKLVGEVASIRKAQEKFALYYIATPPKEPALSAAFEKALLLLRNAPHDQVVVTKAGDEGPLLDDFSRKIQQHATTA